MWLVAVLVWFVGLLAALWVLEKGTPMTDKPAHTPYEQIPQTMRDILDTVYTPAGVEVWWNAKQRWFSGMTPRDLWRTVRGREQVREVVGALEDGVAT